MNSREHIQGTGLSNEDFKNHFKSSLNEATGVFNKMEKVYPLLTPAEKENFEMKKEKTLELLATYITNEIKSGQRAEHVLQIVSDSFDSIVHNSETSDEESFLSETKILKCVILKLLNSIKVEL